MDAWKETLADTMTAWDYRTEKSIWSDNKYYIRVACTSPSVCGTCRSTMQANMKNLCADFKGMQDVDASHFDVRVGSSQAQEQLHRNLNEIVSAVATERHKSGDASSSKKSLKIRSRNIAAVIAVVALTTVIVWLLWKK